MHRINGLEETEITDNCSLVEPEESLTISVKQPLIQSEDIDEFEYYCQLAHSPIRSPTASPPQNNNLLSPDFVSADPNSLSPDMILHGGQFFKKRNSYRSRSVKERRSSNRLLITDDPEFRKRPSSRSLKVRSTSRSKRGSNSYAAAAATTGSDEQYEEDQQHCDEDPNSPCVNQRQKQEIYRVRSFKRTSKGVVSEGDVIRTRSTGNIHQQVTNILVNCPPPSKLTSYHDNRSSVTQIAVDYPIVVTDLDKLLPPDNCSTLLQTYSNPILTEYNSSSPIVHIPNCFTIQVLGGPGVGKSTLCQQFMTSEFLGGKSENVSEEREERYVAVLLENQEWNLTFLDSVDQVEYMSVEVVDSVDAYMVVYSIDDIFSFEYAKEMLFELSKIISSRVALFLVANKSDLERTREITNEDGRRLANMFSCKFLEISTALNHLVDKLLVGIVIQIRNQIKKAEKERDRALKKYNKGCATHIRSTGNLLSTFIRKHFDSKSCEDLTSDIKI